MSTALVSLVDGIPTTTSQIVAETFGKRHTEVIRGIRDLQSKCPEEFNGRNFASVEYTDPKGEKRPMYLLTRDGLTLLVMGYTGKEAMRFKLAYIEAFNCMERQLEAQRTAPAVPPLSSVDARKQINNLVRNWAGVSGLSFPDCWAQIHAAFNIARASDLPCDRVKEAENWVQARIDDCNHKAMPPAVRPAQPDNSLWKELDSICKQLAKLTMAVQLEGTGYKLSADETTRLLAKACNSHFVSAAHSLMVAQTCLNSALTITKRVDFYA